MSTFTEINFDGLIGPTHNYAGLAFGNIASAKYKNSASNPKQAALEGLKKMQANHDFGLIQGFIPPLQRPFAPVLRSMGFTGSLLKMIDDAYRHDPAIVASIFSASSMWTANAGTFIPKNDANDGKYHIIPANLASHFHRSIEASSTASHLKKIFAGDVFEHHDPLSNLHGLFDEGAANHTRLSFDYSSKGFHFFVYGEKGKKFNGRQDLLASQSIARLGQLPDENTIFAKQSSTAIDAGAFHNDVVAVGNERLLFCHESSWDDQEGVYKKLRAKMPWLEIIEVKENEVSLGDAIDTYLFNSQIIHPNDEKGYGLILPMECKENKKVYDHIQRVIEGQNILKFAEFFDLRQSMSNGGGPACLRFRAQISRDDIDQIDKAFIIDESKIDNLTSWVNSSYRDRLEINDLRDPSFIDECFHALDSLSAIIGISDLFEFQRD